jgi:small subunit ribosomal protein S1
MVDRNLVRQFSVADEELDTLLAELGDSMEDIDETVGDIPDMNSIVPGKVLRIEGDEVLIDIGYKSEGVVPAEEWLSENEPLPQPGEIVEVLLEEVEDNYGLILLSKRKADRIREWEQVINAHAEGDVVTGHVVRKIKGGLLVNIGVNVFLPASQVDIRRPRDIGDYIGKDIECQILKIDESRRNIVVSRRKLIEDRRRQQKEELLSVLTEGDVRKGVVKNIADFGAFVDLGGIDGLLHITDMSWGRIGHPSEKVKIDEHIEVKILNIDREREKIALGLKQLQASPWDNVAVKYPVGSKVKGEVVNIMTYGAFVKLEDGIEGLVHISEMSWTLRVKHPSELFQKGDEVEAVLLNIDAGDGDKPKISLGIKQLVPDPWDRIPYDYPTGKVVDGKVLKVLDFGAFVELEKGIEGLVHVSEISEEHVEDPRTVLTPGQAVKVQVLHADGAERKIGLSIKAANRAKDAAEAQGFNSTNAGGATLGDKFRGKLDKLKSGTKDAQ